MRPFPGLGDVFYNDMCSPREHMPIPFPYRKTRGTETTIFFQNCGTQIKKSMNNSMIYFSTDRLRFSGAITTKILLYLPTKRLIADEDPLLPACVLSSATHFTSACPTAAAARRRNSTSLVSSLL